MLDFVDLCSLFIRKDWWLYSLGIFCMNSVCIKYLLPFNKIIVTYKTSKIKLKRRRRRRKIFSSGFGVLVALFSLIAYIDICSKAQPVTRLSYKDEHLGVVKMCFSLLIPQKNKKAEAFTRVGDFIMVYWWGSHLLQVFGWPTRNRTTFVFQVYEIRYIWGERLYNSYRRVKKNHKFQGAGIIEILKLLFWWISKNMKAFKTPSVCLGFLLNLHPILSISFLYLRLLNQIEETVQTWNCWEF